MRRRSERGWDMERDDIRSYGYVRVQRYVLAKQVKRANQGPGSAHYKKT